MLESNDIGASIKKIRVEKKMSLRRLAEATGISLSQLSKIETGKGDTTVRNLQRIARAFGAPVSRIINETETRINPRPIRRGEGFSIGRQASEDPRLKEIFLNMWPNAHMQPETLSIPPGSSSGEALSHEGEEFFYVLEGRARFVIGEKEFEMNKGDLLYFKCDAPHRWENLCEKEWCELLICCSPPTFR
jgi:transcriptional regulator with XRE-family HTH domain